MKCPKCGYAEIHLWLRCICYNCGYNGDPQEFNATKEEIKNAHLFHEIIIRMNQSKELAIELGEGTITTKNRRNICHKCLKEEYRRLMYIVNIIDGLTYRHTVTRYYCIECAKMLFGKIP